MTHQQGEADTWGAWPARGLLWEPGTGKTLATLEPLVHLIERREIRSVLVLAPKGVHRNWYEEEIPKHLPEWILERMLMFCWNSSKMKNKGQQRELARMLDGTEDCRVLFMNYDAVRTPRGIKAIKALMKDGKCALILDESTRVKTPGAKVTKRVRGLAEHADYVRILTGTLIANSPFDAYSQICCLDKDAWRHLGIRTYTAFKSYFGVYTTGYNGAQQREYQQLVDYRNLSKLKEVLGKYCTRYTKDEILDLPPKLYTKRHFELSPASRRLYEQLKAEFIVEMGDEIASAPLAITRMLRLQQITCGYLPTDEGTMIRLEQVNPRISLLEDTLDDTVGSVIIWARFIEDIDQICAAIKARGETFVRYDGGVDDDGRSEAKRLFQHTGEARYFVGNPQAGKFGLTLTRAKTIIYYSNDFDLDSRLQSEDRAHRIGQDNAVLYIDLCAVDSMDGYITDKLVKKHDIARELLGDSPKNWI